MGASLKPVGLLMDVSLTNILLLNWCLNLWEECWLWSAGLSLGREGPSVQIGSYVGCLVSKWGRVLAGERKQLLAAGAGAGLAAAFAAPLASSLLVIESIERFDAPKTAITTLLCGSGGRRCGKYDFSYQSLFSD